MIEPKNTSSGALSSYSGKSRGTFLNLQALRAIAALMVVGEHCIYLWLSRAVGQPNANFWMNGAAGVDIFFVISGFVMTVSLPGLAKYAHPIRTFLHRRISRIVPLYWLATTLKLLLIVLLPRLALHQGISWANVLGSYFFLPVANADGLVAPVIVVGWTLNYEMFFYLSFAIAMLFQKKTFGFLFVFLGGLASASFFSRPSWPAPTALASPMLLEFLFGVAIAQLAIHGRRPGRLVSWLALGIGFVAIMTVFPHLPYESIGSRWRFLIWGGPAAAIVIGAVGLEEFYGNSLPRWLISLGDASYAIYLIQTFVLPVVGVAIVRLGLHGNVALGVAILAGLPLSAIAGEIVHRFVEVPTLALLKNRRQLGAGISS